MLPAAPWDRLQPGSGQHSRCIFVVRNADFPAKAGPTLLVLIPGYRIELACPARLETLEAGNRQPQ
jgi:hypothetical protein